MENRKKLKETRKLTIQDKLDILSYVDGLDCPGNKKLGSYRLAKKISTRFKRSVDPKTVRRILKNRELLERQRPKSKGDVRCRMMSDDALDFDKKVEEKLEQLFHTGNLTLVFIVYLVQGKG